MSETAVRIADEGAVVRITLAGGEQLNAISPATMEELQAALAATSTDDSTRVVILAGEGPAFCAGADLARLPDDRPAIMAAANSLIRQVVDAEVPVIAAVHGAAAGYGASLVLAADIV